MGFIDYHGTKEDRFLDVVEYARDQQKEEMIRRNDASVSKWLTQMMDGFQLNNLNVKELLKYIILRYDHLKALRDTLINGSDIIEPEIIWKDFCIYIVCNHLELFDLSQTVNDKYYSTFMSKVFKYAVFIDFQSHMDTYRKDCSYRQYYIDCFDMLYEKQFWKWIAKRSQGNISVLLEFVDTYKQLSIFIGCYIYKITQSDNIVWMQRLEIEKNALDRIKDQYVYGHFNSPNYNKMINPLYKARVKESVYAGQESVSIVGVKISDFDKDKFIELINKQNIVDYIKAIQMIINYKISIEFKDIFHTLIDRMNVLEESIKKYETVYNPDMFLFYEYYMPEALIITLKYIEYLDADISDNVIADTEYEVKQTCKQLIVTVNDIIDEIYKFGSMELKARARALGTVMGQDGHVPIDERL